MDVSALCPEIPPDSSNALSGLCMPTPQTSACSALKESPPAAFFRGLPRAAGVVSRTGSEKQRAAQRRVYCQGLPAGLGESGASPTCGPAPPRSPAASSGSPHSGNPCPLTPQHLGKKRGPRYWPLSATPTPFLPGQGEVRGQPGLREANTGLKAGDTWMSGAGRRGGEGLMGKKTGAGVRGLT